MTFPTLKQWTHEEAERLKVSPAAIRFRVEAGHYRLKLKRVSPRVILVLESEALPMTPKPGILDMLRKKPTELGITFCAARQRYYRGKL